MKKLTGYQSLTPAYGRDYTSAKTAKESFLDGKDWVLNTPFQTAYCSVRDFAPGASAQLRYKKLASVTVVKVPA